MEAAGALASLAPSPITVLGLIPLLALGITYFRYQQFDPESYIADVNTVSMPLITISSTYKHYSNVQFDLNKKIQVLNAKRYKNKIFLILRT